MIEIIGQIISEFVNQGTVSGFPAMAILCGVVYFAYRLLSSKSWEMKLLGLILVAGAVWNFKWMG